ncbi:MAG: 1-acyl-sn-glycerol-3-phosphate acyltransferase [Candidatus Margulisbacteria bacterium]|nr:1-acyl-sn-glycerol-3-phosphate acyltransferase [Candidatus Margulisiibacteriota bacterium]
MLQRIFHSVFFYLLTVVSFLVGTTITLFFVPFSRSSHKPFQIAGHIWARFLTFFSGVKVQVSGLENIPRDKALILASNHQGAADILILLACLPINFRFAIKKELFKIPIFGWYLKKAGYFSIDRKLVLSAYRTVEAVIEIIKAGESVLIFPEGTRTKTGELGRFKRGSLLAALKSRAPIIPIAISGSFNIMKKGSWLFHPCPVKLSVGKPIEIKSEADYDNKIAEVRETIARML